MEARPGSNRTHGVVVYKLTGGQPDIREYEQSRYPLGPLHGLGESRLLNAF